MICLKIGWPTKFFMLSLHMSFFGGTTKVQLLGANSLKWLKAPYFFIGQ